MIKIGLLGLGTVGSGVLQVLEKNLQEITRRTGCEMCLSMVADKRFDYAKELCANQGDITVTDDAFSVVNHSDIDIVVELIGGTTVAKDLVLTAIKNGKHVVTANKKLLAEYGNDIFKLAEENNVMVLFEAAVAGGIPIIKTLREGLSANRIKWVAGIINGTSNFILTAMCDKGMSFQEALSQAQELGYAEADPTFDIEGQDSAHKVTIMSALAFGTSLHFEDCYIEGITKLNSRDIRYAEELGYRIKLLGITRRHADGIELRVHPTLIPDQYLITHVKGVMNAVWVNADMLGSTLYYGAGAGSLQTASAVVADIAEICRLMTTNPVQRVPYLAFQSQYIEDLPIKPIDEITSSYYLRISALDEKGVMAKISQILATEEVSIEALIQKGTIDNKIAEIVILTHSVQEKFIRKVIEKIENLQQVTTPVVMLRMESFHD